jgi:hypothetical protein
MVLIGSFSFASATSPAGSFEFENQPLQSNQVQESTSPYTNETHIVRDSETILLFGQIIPPKDYIHVYDASPYKIVN